MIPRKSQSAPLLRKQSLASLSQPPIDFHGLWQLTVYNLGARLRLPSIRRIHFLTLGHPMMPIRLEYRPPRRPHSWNVSLLSRCSRLKVVSMKLVAAHRADSRATNGGVSAVKVPRPYAYGRTSAGSRKHSHLLGSGENCQAQIEAVRQPRKEPSPRLNQDR